MNSLLTNFKVCCFTVFFICVSMGAFAGNYAIPVTSETEITDFYTEVEINEHTGNMYVALNFNGGYVGFAGADEESSRFINFSIWDPNGSEAVLVETCDARVGGEDQTFGNEGTGYKTKMYFRWKLNTRYKVYVKTRHTEEGTVYSAWVNEFDSEGWYLCGRIRVNNTFRYVGTYTAFLELFNGGSAERELPHRCGIGAPWIKNSSGWKFCSTMKWRANDVETLHKSYLAPGKQLLYLSTERNNTGDVENNYIYEGMTTRLNWSPVDPDSIAPRYYIENLGSGKVLTATGAGEVYPGETVDNFSSWEMIDIPDSPMFIFDNIEPDSLYRLHAKEAEGLVVNLVEGIWSGSNTQWQLVKSGEGLLYIIHSSTGLRLNAADGELKLVPSSWTGDYSKWMIKEAP